MIRFIGVAVFCVALCVSWGRTQEKKEEAKKDDVEWKMDYIEKTFNVKLKSASIQKSMEPGQEQGNEIKLLFEFTKDIENLADMKIAFTPPARLKGNVAPQIKLWFHFFDGDNVKIGKIWLNRTDGELSGKQGDAFRVYISTQGQEGKFKKVEVRPKE